MTQLSRSPKAKASPPDEKDRLEILDHIPDGLFTMDAARRIRYFNRAAQRMTGLSASEALGMPCKEVFKSPTCEDHCPLAAPPGSTREEAGPREILLTRTDGAQVPVLCSFSALFNGRGDVVGGIEAFKDISERKRLEDDLRLSERQYRRIVEGSKDMILITSRDGVIKEANQAGVELLGYGSKEELLRLPSVRKIYDNPRHWEVFQKQINREGFVKDFEAVFLKQDGTRLHCLLSGNAARGRDGEIIGYESIAKDITARMDAVRSLRQRHWELWLLNSVAFAMNKTQDLDEILMIALTKALEVLNLPSGGIFLIDTENSAFALRVQKGLTAPGDTKACRIRLYDAQLMGALLEKHLSLKPQPIFPPFRAALSAGDNSPGRELTCFLITAKEKASGFLAFEVPPERDLTTGQDYHLLGSLGNFLGGAVENALLQQTIRRHREELKRLTAQLFHSQEAERKRIARELHDEAGQALTGIHFTLETIEKALSAESVPVKALIGEVKKQINRTHQEMRRISYRLHPALLSDLGLEPALDADLTAISRHGGPAVEFKMVGFDGRLDPETEIVLYRLSQEALTNTLKHARAEHFRLTITKGYPRIIFLAEDDGVGFMPGDVHQSKQALGLLSMRERAAMLGGTFTLRTAPGKGTRIRIEIPVEEETHD